MTNTSSSPDNVGVRRNYLLRNTSDTNLIQALLVLDADVDSLDPAEKLARAWMIDELESRYPVASQAVQDAFDNAGDENVDYVGVLVGSIRGQVKGNG
jgi:hypothetical protein